MTIHLTPEQERRLRAVLDRGAYKSVEEVVEAALTAVEQRTVPGFARTPEELDAQKGRYGAVYGIHEKSVLTTSHFASLWFWRSAFSLLKKIICPSPPALGHLGNRK